MNPIQEILPGLKTEIESRNVILDSIEEEYRQWDLSLSQEEQEVRRVESVFLNNLKERKSNNGLYQSIKNNLESLEHILEDLENKERFLVSNERSDETPNTEKIEELVANINNSIILTEKELDNLINSSDFVTLQKQEEELSYIASSLNKL